MSRNSTITINKKSYSGVRIAFAGCMASGKSHASALLKKKIGNASIKSFSSKIKELARKNILFANREGYQLVGEIGRTIDPQAWIHILVKELNQMEEDANIIIDDIRYENELIALHSLGFQIVYMKTPWHIRLKRIKERYHDDPPCLGDVVQWVTHESELQLESLSDSVFDKVIVHSKELLQYIDSV